MPRKILTLRDAAECPHCKRYGYHHRLAVRTTPAANGSKLAHLQIECLKCRMRGPSGRGLPGIIKSWNRLQGVE